MAPSNSYPYVYTKPSGGVWSRGTQLYAVQASNCSTNTRYDVLNSSNPFDIDVVVCIENYNSNTAQLMYVNGTITASGASLRPNPAIGVVAVEAGIDAPSHVVSFVASVDSSTA